ncbi:MAG: bacillithiol system redox-active protein YtxJ [FCB group bacterium]|nr:bacillithiol system redox-active protein YtxJ [FCB group bacterium]
MKEISTLDEWQEILEASGQHAVFLFKHSTTCPISASARDKVNEFLTRATENGIPPFHLIRVIESRPISNKIEADLGVRHQSPQLILLKEKKAVWSASHYGIQGDKIREAIQGLM